MIRKHTMELILAAITTCWITGPAFAQEDENVQVSEHVEMTIISDNGIGGATMIFSTGQRLAGLNPSIGISALGSDKAMAAPDPFSMLNDPSVQKDLELVGDQLEAIKEMQKTFAKEMREQLGDITKGGLSKDRLKNLPALLEKLESQQRKKMESMLLPHQVDRLRQVALQSHMKRAGTAGALASKQIAEAIGLAEEQIEKMKSRAKEINEKLANDVAALKEQAKEDLLIVLTTEQRKKLKEMTGDKFEPQAKDWQESTERIRDRRKQFRREDN